MEDYSSSIEMQPKKINAKKMSLAEGGVREDTCSITNTPRGQHLMTIKTRDN